jgi:hypothetical protein
VPLCRVHHRAVHYVGIERARWKSAGVDPLKIARKLWKERRVNEVRIEPHATSQTADRALKLETGDPKGPTPA